MSDKVRIFALGGLDEYGKNLYCVDINDDIFVFECGIKFPDKSTPGVNFIIADYTYLAENKNRVKGIFISHGHEDMMGGLGFLFTKAGLKAPVYGTDVTIAFCKRDLQRLELKPEIEFHIVKPDIEYEIAGHKFMFFQTAHSIMGSVGIAIETDMGYIVYTGNFIVEYNGDNLNNRLDIVALSKFSARGVALLMCESIGAEIPGFTAPSHKLVPLIAKQFGDAPGRVFFALYDYDIYRLGEILKLCITNKKKIIFLGEQTNSILQTLNSVGQFAVPKENIASLDDIFRIREQDLVFIIMGHRKSLFTQITSIAGGDYEDKKVMIKPTDTFIIAAPAVEGIETVTIDTVDDVYRTGCNVIYINDHKISSMHAHEDDLRTLLSILHPKFYLPVAGEFRHLLANAKIATNSSLGYNHMNTIILDNGMILELSENKIRILEDTIHVGDLLVDGIGVGDVGALVLAERQKLADDGVVCMSCGVSSVEKKAIAGPDIQMRGFVLVKDSESLIDNLAEIITSTCNEILARDGTIDEIKEDAHEKAVKYLRKVTGRDPMVLPIIIDIDSKE